MTADLHRVIAVTRKEVREFRRNPFIVGTMLVLPAVFLIAPLVSIFSIGRGVAETAALREVGSAFLVMLIVPVVLPAAIAAYAVVGERDQGTLEPLLTSPLRRSELLLGKALAAILPSVGISYGLLAVVLVTIRVWASATAFSAVWQAPQILAQVLFVPLLAAWSIWVGIGISARAGDVRVAQQLSILASLPPLAFTALGSFHALTPSVPLAAGMAMALAGADILLWRVVSRLFDRERLIAGTHAVTGTEAAAMR